ncbi:MAG: 50S ribosomal protein L3 [Deltaproteobacteria bacterium]|nr:50S ribosomal protein L3 [Deltaproteobacteria bacterium]
MKAIYGKKVGMGRVFDSAGEVVPVTVLQVAPNIVHQVKTKETDGYSAIQVGIGEQKPQRVDRALSGHLAKAKKGFSKDIKEIRVDKLKTPADTKAFNVGDEVTIAGMFNVGDRVDVMGITTGKGFAGVMKRHGMAGAKRTHGTHEYFRHGGSIGCRKFPGRVFKNKRMPGHMGAVRVVQEGLEVVGIRENDNALLLKGSVPGTKGSVVFVQESLKG